MREGRGLGEGGGDIKRREVLGEGRVLGGH